MHIQTPPSQRGPHRLPPLSESAGRTAENPPTNPHTPPTRPQIDSRRPTSGPVGPPLAPTHPLNGKTCLWAELPEFAVKDLPLGRTDDDIRRNIYIIVRCLLFGCFSYGEESLEKGSMWAYRSCTLV